MQESLTKLNNILPMRKTIAHQDEICPTANITYTEENRKVREKDL